MLRNLIVFTFVLFVANILRGVLPEYGRTGGWDYSFEESQKDCAEYGRHARVYHIDQEQRYYFECMN